MKDIYVNKDGIICACTVEVPKAEFRGMTGHIQMLVHQEALQACKESSVEFEEQHHAFHALYLETKTDYKINASFSEWFNNFPKPDTFYQIDAYWEIVETWTGMVTINDKTSGNMQKKVARLKVPAPTVATDNSGDIVGVKAWIKFDREFVPSSVEQIWKEIYMDFKDGEGWIAFSKRMDKMYTITRKS